MSNLQRFEELSNMIEELTPSAGDEPAPVFSPEMLDYLNNLRADILN